jgi:DNA-binding NarL/FixJ family response regulator
MEDEIVVAVDDHRRILGAGVSVSPLVTEPPLRILLAEDDDQLATLVGTILDGDGRFTVVGRATTGDGAITLCEEHAPDIVLMDIGMPGRDGIDATRAIHARDPEQHVVIYTGSDEYSDVARAEDAGAVGYLHKDALTSPDLADALHVLHANYVSSVPDPD